jgi:hypothetical protein
MAQKLFQVDINLDGNELKNVVVDKVTTDPVSPAVGQFWYNTTVNKLKYYDGTSVRIIASEAYVTNAINQLGQIQGGFSAVPGLLPVAGDKTQGDLTAIKKGDYWVITAAGTIAGIEGSDVLSVGDIIQFYGSNPATASDWLGIQRNLDDSAIGDTKTERQTVNLVANTPLNVNAATITDIFSVQTYNSAGEEIIVSISKLGPANQVTLESKKSLTGVKVDLVGKA